MCMFTSNQVYTSPVCTRVITQSVGGDNSPGLRIYWHQSHTGQVPVWAWPEMECGKQRNILEMVLISPSTNLGYYLVTIVFPSSWKLVLNIKGTWIKLKYFHIEPISKFKLTICWILNISVPYVHIFMNLCTAYKCYTHIVNHTNDNVKKCVFLTKRFRFTFQYL